MKITFEQDSGNVVVWDVSEEKLSQLLNVRGCAMNFGINEHTASARVRRGWPVLLALATDDEEKQ
ncbi:hypothetical protein [Pantoea anthophila]|uniref:DNA-binding protein n=1 Tax=Pantoea anthophila TaxID=470931 RepID=A0ABY2ZFY2_9GAMM|nr:hypothetical protein [Pantoea anthophila]TPV32738.1 hypothetical protein FJW00_01855 [Pantoea anthophila]